MKAIPSRFIVLVSLLLFTPCLSFSQVSLSQFDEKNWVPQFSKMKISPSIGVMYTDLAIQSDSVSVQTTPRVGYALGINVHVPTSSDYLDYSSGFFYWHSQTTVETRGGALSFTEYTRSTLSFRRFSVPLMAKIYPFSKRLGLYTRAGLFNHFLLSATQETTSTVIQKSEVFGERVNTTSSQQSLDSSDGYNYYVLDGVVGLGLEMGVIQNIGFFVELNYLFGLTPVAEGQNTIRSDSYYATLGIGF